MVMYTESSYRGINLLYEIFKKGSLIMKIKLGKKSYIALGILLIMVLGTAWSSYTASTPEIKDSEGNKLENSIAKLIEVELNGSKQWITIRGEDKSNPVILFLAGGPGGTQLVETRQYLQPLEKYFTIVNWDQPGSGKSYRAVNKAELTRERYIDDCIALTKYLKNYLNKDKIYLMGQSWGTALAVWTAIENPSDYHAVINSGQMVDFVETEKICYEYVLEKAKKDSDTKLEKKLIEQGAPPYYGKGVTKKSATYLMKLSEQMSSNPQIHNSGYTTLEDIMSEEYSVIDKVNYIRGIVTTFENVYPKLYDKSLLKTGLDLPVPIFIIHGKHDLNAPVSLVNTYYDRLRAPHKELIWFDHSGHTPWRNENQLFIETIMGIHKKVNELEKN